MKKFAWIVLAALAFGFVSCENDELNEISEKVRKADEKTEGKKDVNFRIFNDRINKGKE